MGTEAMKCDEISSNLMTTIRILDDFILFFIFLNNEWEHRLPHFSSRGTPALPLSLCLSLSGFMWCLVANEPHSLCFFSVGIWMHIYSDELRFVSKSTKDGLLLVLFVWEAHSLTSRDTLNMRGKSSIPAPADPTPWKVMIINNMNANIEPQAECSIWWDMLEVFWFWALKYFRD